MRCQVDASDQELVDKADVLLQHICDLREAARARVGAGEALAKSRGLTIKDHPRLALTQLRRIWVTGYRQQMAEMVAEIGAYLESLPPTDLPPT